MREQAAAAAALSRKVRRLIRTIDAQVKNRRAGDGNASGDAMMARPRSIAVLKVEDLRSDLRVPLFPLITTAAFQAVADIEVREELLAADGTEAIHKPCVGELTLYRRDLFSVLLPVVLGAAQLFQRLRALIKRHACGIRRSEERRV